MHALQASRKRQEFGWHKVFFWFNIIYLSPGGGGGIRTRDTVSRIHTFQACAFSRSATPPRRASNASRAHITAHPPRASRRAPIPTCLGLEKRLRHGSADREASSVSATR